MLKSLNNIRILVFVSLLISANAIFAQPRNSRMNLVYVDNQGVMRWNKDKKEATFFGVNYTVPFAYGLRSHKALGVDPEKAIDNDVYHFARLGLDAFRVHMWDVEISDTMGNLLNNEQLRLFDYLVFKLKQRNIKIILTPIAFWGNGYPERDEKTPGFATKYGKGPSVVNPDAIKAQENYIRQMMKHINPYTKLNYCDDEDIIAMEINNEPHHSGAKKITTDYINSLANAARQTGWTKPVFYNISESPFYSDAVVAAKVDGHSFQWYPTGLVAGRTVMGNHLPHVDHYAIPFDSIPAFSKRAKMVYEFDAGDILDPIMYPAMARSFRTAGFQWATQFAYDPIATAYANTEYQTHFLNLAYTPAKAISFLIASKAFHKLPRLKSYGTYPADTLFDVFRVSYRESLSEMNSDNEFYYSNNTTSSPVNSSKLQHVAGVGSSQVVVYSGTGAYFLDKLSNGLWRLEVMPDALFIRDPFEKASPSKEVSRIQWNTNRMKIVLADIGASFNIKGINSANSFETKTENGSFDIRPGTYLLFGSNAKINALNLSSQKTGEIILNEFVAPAPSISETYVQHIPIPVVTEGQPFIISTKIAGVDTSDKISVELRHSSNRGKTVSMLRKNVFEYTAEVPAENVTSGLINYRIIIQKSNGSYLVFPGAHKGNPYAWDAITNESWQTFVASKHMPVEIFNASTNRNNISIYNTDWRNNRVEYITVDKPGQLVLNAVINKPAQGKIMAWQCYFGDKLKGRETELSSVDKIKLRAKSSNNEGSQIKIGLITKDGITYRASSNLTDQFKEIEILLNEFLPDNTLLLPRPYPGFLPLRFNSSEKVKLNIADLEKLEISFGEIVKDTQQPLSIQVEFVHLIKNKQ